MNAEVSKGDMKLSRKEEEKDTNKEEQIKNEVQREEENMKDEVNGKQQKERRERMVDVINKEFSTFIDGKKADLATIDQNILKGNTNEKLAFQHYSEIYISLVSCNLYILLPRISSFMGRISSGKRWGCKGEGRFWGSDISLLYQVK